MSSYISSRYTIEHNRLSGIIEQCRQEVKNAANAITAINAERDAARQASADRQRELTQKEQSARDAAALQMAGAAAQRKIVAGRAKALLRSAAEKVAAAEKEGQGGALREQLQVMQNSLTLFGATEQLCRQLEAFDHYLAHRPARPAVAPVAAVSGIQDALADKSREFVSLRSENAAPAARRQSPWQRFVQRVQVQCEAQEPFGETSARQLLEQAMQIPPEKQNWFLLAHQQELARIEQTTAEIAGVRQTGLRQKQHLWQEYRAVCLLCGARPGLTQQSDAASLERETARLFEAYTKEREQQYVSNAFTQVLERYGIDFDTMENAAEGCLHLQYHMSAGAQLHVTRSEAGAFEMEFAGVSASNSASMDERRQVVEKARSFCSLLPQIAQELKERGIVFDQVAVQQPDEQNVRILHRHEKSERFTARKAKQMPL